MRQASANPPIPYGAPQQYGAYQPTYGPVPYTTAQPPHIWDWRDYFASAFVATCTVIVSLGLFRLQPLFQVQ